MPKSIKPDPVVIPSAKDVNQLAEFFDTHSTEAFDWQPSDVEIEKKDELVSISVRLPKSDIERLKATAAKMGIGYTTFVRMVLRRAIQSE